MKNMLAEHDLVASESGGKERAIIARGTRLHWFHWGVVALSLVLTVGAWYFAYRQVEQKNQIEFNRQATQIVDLVLERMQLYENALWGGVAFIDARGGEISYQEWVAYSDSLHIDQSYPGVNGIGVIYHVMPGELEPYIARERVSRPVYHVHPEHEQPEHWPITYIEPVESNQKAVGLDMAFEENRYTGILRTRNTGTAQVTGPITLVQDARQTPGFLFYAPFYRNGQKPETPEGRKQHSHGVTYAPFIMSRLMNGTLASRNRQVRVKISDAGDLLFDDQTDLQSDKGDIDPKPMFSKTIAAPVYGRTWMFDIETGLAFRQASSNNQPYMILIGGLIIDALLLGLFILLTRANQRALSYADSATQSLREESLRLERSNRDLEQFAYVASHDLKAPLRGIHNLAVWIEENIQDKMDEETRDYMSLLKNRVSRLEGLLAGLLEYSRAGRKDLEWTEVDLDELVEQVADLHAVPDAGFKVVHNLPTIEASEVALDQILRNLIGNAIKHHDKDTGTIEVSYRKGAQHHVITVSDDGPGIPLEFRDKAFKMFQTLRPRDEVEGSGMGLAIVRKLVQQLGGEIWIEDSASGKGLAVSFSIALTPQE